MAGRPPRAGTLRPAEARDVQPERLPNEPSVCRQASNRRKLNAPPGSTARREHQHRNAFPPLAPLAAQGANNVEIAERLFMSRSTVKHHLAHVYAKLNIAGRTQLAAITAARNHER
ncbi:MAG: response regulator transcription factor [Solirubrobacteraceae bacterium]